MGYHALLAVSIPFLYKALKNYQFDTLLGKLSYLMYISHLLVAIITQMTTIQMLNSVVDDGCALGQVIMYPGKICFGSRSMLSPKAVDEYPTKNVIVKINIYYLCIVYNYAR